MLTTLIFAENATELQIALNAKVLDIVYCFPYFGVRFCYNASSILQKHILMFKQKKQCRLTQLLKRVGNCLYL